MEARTLGTIRRNLAFVRHLRPRQVLRRVQLDLLRRWRVRHPPQVVPAKASPALRHDFPLSFMPPRGGLDRTSDGRWRFTFLNRSRDFSWPILDLTVKTPAQYRQAGLPEAEAGAASQVAGVEPRRLRNLNPES